MLFLTDGGEPFATATAWHDHGAQGRLHWVGVDAAHQGMGLSKPLVSLALQRLREVGYRSAMLTTQTASWVAIKVYHRFGFRPLLRKGCEAEGWKIVSDKTGSTFCNTYDKEGSFICPFAFWTRRRSGALPPARSSNGPRLWSKSWWKIR